MIALLEEAVPNNPGLAFDAAKALTESICKTVLQDRQQAFDRNASVHSLVKATLATLALAPEDHEGEVQRILQEMGGALQSVAKALGELRNKEGFISHGRDIYHRELDQLHGVVAAKIAEVIVYLIYMTHMAYPQVSIEPEPRYADFEEFNSYLDDLHGSVQIVGLDLSPSEVLWRVDPEAYKIQKTAFEQLGEDEEID